MNRLREREIKAFVRFMMPIQMRITEKYGPRAIYQWRQRRLQRRKVTEWEI